MNKEPLRRPYRFGPVGLLARFQRWHARAPLWQIVLLTSVLIVLIALMWSGGLGVVRR